VRLQRAASGLTCAGLAVLVAGLVAGTAQAEPVPESFFGDAYKACVNVLAAHIKPAGSKAVEFAPASDVTMKDDEEFTIAFSLGSIRNADFAEPDPVTLLDKPAGSCLGTPGVRTFERIVLNGKVLEGANLSF